MNLRKLIVAWYRQLPPTDNPPLWPRVKFVVRNLGWLWDRSAFWSRNRKSYSVFFCEGKDKQDVKYQVRKVVLGWDAGGFDKGYPSSDEGDPS